MVLPSILSDTHPRLVERITRLQADYYAAHWGFGHFSETEVASELATFVARYHPDTDLRLRVEYQDRIEGSLAIDGADEGAHLCWFIVSDRVQGSGLGHRLLQQAVRLCRDHRYPRISLWTFEGQEAARHLYLAHGFELTHAQTGDQWGTRVVEQQYELDLS